MPSPSSRLILLVLLFCNHIMFLLCLATLHVLEARAGLSGFGIGQGYICYVNNLDSTNFV